MRPPKGLTENQHLLLAQTRELLEQIQPSQAPPELTSADLGNDSDLTLRIRHLVHDDMQMTVLLDRYDQLIVNWWTIAHEDFMLGDYDTPVAGISDGLGFVEQALLGRLEVDATFRGKVPCKATTYWVDQDGTRHGIGTTGLLIFNPFKRPKRRRVRISFSEPV